MYKYSDTQMILPHDFFLPFGGKLNPDNRWCRLATLIPWPKIEGKYAQNFNSDRPGKVAFSVRIALGALIIKHQKRLSDRETVQEIAENVYMQYFIGLPGFADKAPFDPSLMVRFRKRLGPDIVGQLNDWIKNPQKELNI